MGFYSTIFQEILEIVFFLFKLNGLDLFAAYLACISLTKFETAVDLGQEPNVTKCNIRLANEEDFSVRIYASLQCRFGASGRYVYIYKLGYGSVVLNEVIVLEEARSYELTGGYDWARNSGPSPICITRWRYESFQMLALCNWATGHPIKYAHVYTQHKMAVILQIFWCIIFWVLYFDLNFFKRAKLTKKNSNVQIMS